MVTQQVLALGFLSCKPVVVLGPFPLLSLLLVEFQACSWVLCSTCGCWC